MATPLLPGRKGRAGRKPAGPAWWPALMGRGGSKPRARLRVGSAGRDLGRRLCSSCWRGGCRQSGARTAGTSGSLLELAFLAGGTENPFNNRVLPDAGFVSLILQLLTWGRDVCRARAQAVRRSMKWKSWNFLLRLRSRIGGSGGTWPRAAPGPRLRLALSLARAVGRVSFCLLLGTSVQRQPRSKHKGFLRWVRREVSVRTLALTLCWR